jgi:hypothetical protein
MNLLAIKVAARFQRLADQPSGARRETKKNVQPINKPKGINQEIQRDNAKSQTKGEETVKSDRRDIQPSDVFMPLPKNTGVLNLAETGKDLSKAIEKQIPKDKGYDAVYNLSQYLVRTDGGGSGGPEGKK